MGATKPEQRLSLEEFLAWENLQEERHEYVVGEIFAMTSGRDAHNTISLNLASLLRKKLLGAPCRVYIADMKLRLDHADVSLYPDVIVTYDRRDKEPAADLAKHPPTLVVEVLTDSTAAYDYGRKFELYRSLKSLRAYALTAQDRGYVDLFRKAQRGVLVLFLRDQDDSIEFPNIPASLSVVTIHEDVLDMTSV